MNIVNNYLPYKDHQKRIEYSRKYRILHPKLYIRYRHTHLLYQRRKRIEIQQWYREIKKQLKCIKCGESDWRCIDFHHRNKNDKMMQIGDMISDRYSKEKILEEIAKCDPLCANCHRKEHIRYDDISAPVEI